MTGAAVGTQNDGKNRPESQSETVHWPYPHRPALVRRRFAPSSLGAMHSRKYSCGVSQTIQRVDARLLGHDAEFVPQFPNLDRPAPLVEVVYRRRDRRST